MPFWIIYLFLGVFLLWSIFIIGYVNNMVDVKFQYLANPKVHYNPEYLGFNRNDFKNWNKKEMILGGIFLVPIRFFVFMVALISTWSILKLLLIIFRIKNLDQEQPLLFIKLTRSVTRYACRMALFSFGIYKIHVIKKKFNPSNEKLQLVTETRKSVIISNHVSFLDILYFLSSPDTPCFIAKSGVKDIPFIGMFAQILQCIFLDRLNKDARQEVLNLLQERVKKINSNLNYSKILIFPEGTTTNGRSLIDFKKGAFVLDTPLKIVGLKYKGKFSQSFNLIPLFDLVLGILMQKDNYLTVYEMEGLIGCKKNIGWLEYMEATRELMCQEFGLENTGGSFEKYLEFEKLYGIKK